ncbi:neuferricin isoform X5 [Bufo gargarizans]|uniref:neuferricin isoform X5 n=1 Tax=Bufo gargarizans TaxID=30331 RepID=UPI001CF30663|nr:neuferricin isoform X5 [Bufo gargarizans]
MLGYLAAAAVCLAAVLVLRTDPWSFPEVPGLSYIFPEQCKEEVICVKRLLMYLMHSKGCLPSLRDWRLHRCWPSRRCVRTLPNTDVTPQQLAQLLPEELCRGKLIGHFYDEDGDPTKALEDALTVIDVGLKLKEQRHEENKQFPPCNSEFSSGASKVWCSKNSGGIKRDWVGVPRKLYLAGYDGYRCVCVRTNGPPSENPDSKEHNDRGDLDNPSLKEYKDCNPLFDWCWLKE